MLTSIDSLEYSQGGYLHIRRSGGEGGLDLTSSLEAKFGARYGQVHQIRGKTWEILLPQDTKVGKNPNFGVKSQIQKAKFGLFVTYILEAKIGAPTRISEANFGAKPPPRPLNMEVPPLGSMSLILGYLSASL